ncbi:unnamed protein product [Spirodela intermedia]|uniref:CASP-like protein n=1 Tax=Spirodela intermedia TaxID=51605 RepID=A0A7I8JYX4_SPIIN|nr:unnamed protein product [Spirodela intermedia]
MEFLATAAGAHGGGDHARAENLVRPVNYVLRILALVTTFIAAIIVGVAREAESLLTVSGVAGDFKVKATGNPQFDYFVAVNAIVCIYSAASLWIWMKGGTKKLTFALAMVDLVAVVLLFSGLGSASAMGILFRKGYGDFCPNICKAFSKFCAHVFAGIAMSTFSAVAYLLLVFLSLVNLYASSSL